MDNMLQEKFEKMGAHVKLKKLGWFEPTRTRFSPPAIRVDVRRDEIGEYFEVRHRSDVNLDVPDVKRTDRHLVLTALVPEQAGVETKSTYLCGHDERAWFVAAVPESANAFDVREAKNALKPDVVWASIREHKVPQHLWNHRRNDAFVRQGEWFFIPRRRLVVEPADVLQDEPIRRGAGKPHVCQRLCRTGGDQVWVSGAYPNGLTLKQYRALTEKERRKHAWRPMVRDARVYAKGAISHPDHETIWLSFWHEVVMNTETRAKAMQHVAFLD